MGYTHYFYTPTEIDPLAFDVFANDVLKLTEAAGVPLAGWDGTGDPEITAKTVGLNGVGEDDSHETFRVSQTWEPSYPGDKPADDGLNFHFCKTARKPYDVVVVASLIALKHRLGEAVQISSDGDDADWDEGRALAQSTLGFGNDYAIHGSGDDRGLRRVEQEVV